MKTISLSLLLEQNKLSMSDMKNINGGSSDANCTILIGDVWESGYTEAEAKASGSEHYICE